MHEFDAFGVKHLFWKMGANCSFGISKNSRESFWCALQLPAPKVNPIIIL